MKLLIYASVFTESQNSSGWKRLWAHWVQSPAQAGTPKTGFPGLCWGNFWSTAMRQTPQTLWATWTSAQFVTVKNCFLMSRHNRVSVSATSPVPGHQRIEPRCILFALSVQSRKSLLFPRLNSLSSLSQPSLIFYYYYILLDFKTHFSIFINELPYLLC